jgi:IS30 family transposase
MHDSYYITYSERRRIEIMNKRGVSPKEMAEKLGVHIATIYRELKRGCSGGEYSAKIAQAAIQESISHKGKKKTKI